MTLPIPVILESRHLKCIWCEQIFSPRGSNSGQTLGLKSVKRSREHIFPQNIFGNLITHDLCKSCNEMFGCNIDKNLLSDQRVMAAATRAGIKNEELLKKFNGTQSSPDGREFKIAFQQGNYQLSPQLKDLTQLGIGSVGGKLEQNDVVDLKNRLKQKVQQKFNLTELPNELELRVSHLIESMAKNPDQTHYDAVIDESFKPLPLATSIKVPMQCDPWITDWCIAKILFSVTACLMPELLLSKLPVQKYLRQFVQDGLSLQSSGSSQSIFESGHDGQNTMQHSVVVCVTQTSYSGIVRLFGSAWWKFACELTFPTPQQGFRIEAINSFGDSALKTFTKVTPL